MDKLAFVDVETTGSRINYDRIIEIGILRVENGQVVKTFQTLLNPGIYLSPYITQITGIEEQDLKNAPTFEDIKDDVLAMLADCYFVAHNARFDYSFVKNELRRLNHKFTAKLICTVKLSQQLFPQHRHHNLDSIIERFNFTCKNRHRAFDDAEIMWKFYQAAQLLVPEETFTQTLNKITKRPTLPVHISEEMLEKIPESPGVYIFYDENNMPLYIGKSINLKDRILSHFSNASESTKEMNICHQIKHIETIQTTGELGALLLESSLIKQMLPVYNRQLRISSKLLALKKTYNPDGFLVPILETIEKLGVNDLESLITIFRSRKQAKDYLNSMAKEFGLCKKLLGLEKTKGSCFYHKLDICKGACLNKEKCEDYNERFEQAFNLEAIKPWPYDGPIVIEEQNPFEGKKEEFIVDKWCYLGKMSLDDGCYDQNIKNDYVFDFDVYKILHRYLKNAPHRIKTLSRQQFEQYTSSFTTS